MKIKQLVLIAIMFLSISIFAQTKKGITKNNLSTELARPKLVVGIVVDQMRWDYLYRYYNRYTSGGFKRLLNEGFSCENTMINYMPSYTAVGHTTIFTGSVPAIDGIVSNSWIEQSNGKKIYCTDDNTVTGVGAAEAEGGKMSPRNLLVSTITDELRLATNFKSQVVGISLKDRASILPAGHLGKAFWLDDNSGNFITSSYYADSLPNWIVEFNNQKYISRLIEHGWNTLYSINTYSQSTADNVSWEGSFNGEKNPVFPYNLKEIYAKNKSSFRATPFGNTLTLKLATEAINAYNLGKSVVPDFLTINCASTDYVGHRFGPNSIEIEDTYLRLDKDLADFFTMLDAKIGKGNYLLFLTADHGAAHSIGFMKENKIPANFWKPNLIADTLNKILFAQFDVPKLVLDVMNYQVDFNLSRIEELHLDIDAIKKTVINFLQKQPGISYVIDMDKLGELSVPEPIKAMVINGYYKKRCGQVQIILDAGWFESANTTGTNHGSWNPYDTHIPLIFMGWKIKHGQTAKTHNITDISATLAALLHIQMPSGCIGKPIEELTNN